jgi:hypothetical protein
MNKKKGINIRVTDEEKQQLEANSKKYNFISLSDFLRFVGLNTKITTEAKNEHEKTN